MASRRGSRKAPEKDHKRCVIYARYSSARQREESIEDQVRVCTMFAKSNGMEVERVYADKALSGKSDDRPQFQRMVADSRDAGWGVVVVYRLDRFARDRFDSASYRMRLRDNGVSLLSAMERIPDAPEGSILESVLEGVNEWYSRELSQNVRRGMAGNARKCKANGVRVFGYRVGDDGRYAVDEDEAACVRRAFAMAANGSTKTEVRDWLNNACRNVRGGAWTVNSVTTLLGNRKYLGIYKFGDVVVEGGMPALVTQERFDAANGKRKHGRVGAFPLTGKLFDAESGRAYRGDGGTGCTGKRYFYYSCPTEGGGMVRYRQEAVEDAVTDVVSSVMARPGQAEALADAVLAAIERRDEAKRLERAREELREVQRGRERLVDAIIGGIDPELVQERLEGMGDEARRLECEIANLERATTPDRDWAIRWLRAKFPKNITKQVLRRTIGRVEISGDGTVTVEVPWAVTGSMGKEKPSEPPASWQFGGITFGGRKGARLNSISRVTGLNSFADKN